MAASLVVGLFGKAISEKTAHRLTIFAVFLSFVFSGIVLADSLSGLFIITQFITGRLLAH